jgi:ribosome-binding factor A
MVNNLRMERLEEQFKREIGELVLTKMRDPRVNTVTVMGVKISSELDIAKVFIAILGDRETKKDVLKVLDNAAGFIRSELADKIGIRRMPKMKFILDETTEQSMHIDRILTDLGFPRSDFDASRGSDDDV